MGACGTTAADRDDHPGLLVVGAALRARSTACWSPGSGCRRWPSRSARSPLPRPGLRRARRRGGRPTSRAVSTDRAFGNFAGTRSRTRSCSSRSWRWSSASCCTRRRSGARSSRSAPTRRPRYFSGLRVKRIKLACSSSRAGLRAGRHRVLAALSTGGGERGRPRAVRVAAVLLGGVSIFGGRGTSLGVIFALLPARGIAERAHAQRLDHEVLIQSSPAACCWLGPRTERHRVASGGATTARQVITQEEGS